MNPHDGLAASPWIVRFAALVPPGAEVLDVAAGAGRHAAFFLARGHRVSAVDRDPDRLAALPVDPGRLAVVTADLEDGSPWPFTGRRFGGVVVTNYLHRPLLPVLVASVTAGGALLYETFAQGHERFGRPRHPDHLLAPGELLDAAHGRLQVVAYEHLTIDVPRPAVVQRLAALAPATCGDRART